VSSMALVLRAVAADLAINAESVAQTSSVSEHDRADGNEGTIEALADPAALVPWQVPCVDGGCAAC
jgi:hypothetical protein